MHDKGPSHKSLLHCLLPFFLPSKLSNLRQSGISGIKEYTPDNTIPDGIKEYIPDKIIPDGIKEYIPANIIPDDIKEPKPLPACPDEGNDA